MIGLVRLDPIPEGSFGFRAYRCPVDTSAPLSSMTQAYEITGVVTIRGDEAEVTMTRGELGRRALRDFEKMLVAQGASTMVWDRHLSDGTVRRVRRRIEHPKAGPPSHKVDC